MKPEKILVGRWTRYSLSAGRHVINKYSMDKKYILALDQGTTGSRAFLFVCH